MRPHLIQGSVCPSTLLPGNAYLKHYQNQKMEDCNITQPLPIVFNQNTVFVYPKNSIGQTKHLLNESSKVPNFKKVSSQCFKLWMQLNNQSKDVPNSFGSKSYGNTLTRRMLLIGISVKTPVGTGATPGLGGDTAAAGVQKEVKKFLVLA